MTAGTSVPPASPLTTAAQAVINESGWGNVAEWVGAIGTALAAFATVAAIWYANDSQRKNHQREDARQTRLEARQLEADEQRLVQAHRHNREQLTDAVGVEFVVTAQPGHNVAKTTLRNESALRLHNVHAILVSWSTQSPAAPLQVHIPEIPANQAADDGGNTTFHGGANEGKHNAALAFQDRDGFAYSLVHGRLRRAPSVRLALDFIAGETGLNANALDYHDEWVPD